MRMGIGADSVLTSPRFPVLEKTKLRAKTRTWTLIEILFRMISFDAYLRQV